MKDGKKERPCGGGGAGYGFLASLCYTESLKNHKASGKDGLSAELFKTDAATTATSCNHYSTPYGTERIFLMTGVKASLSGYQRKGLCQNAVTGAALHCYPSLARF